jgi:PAS domain S-box-containing protein
MVRSRVPVALGVLSAAALLLGTAASIWARQVDALLGTGTLFTAIAPWITGALGVSTAALALALYQRSRDAPGRPAASSQAREGEVRLDAIVQSAMDAIITVDGDQRIVFFNPAALKMFGCSAAEAIGAPLERFIPERFRAAHAQHVERFGRTGETSRRMGMQSTLWARHADGTEFPIEASISHATVGGRKLLTVILRDITDRLAAEREIRRSHQEVREEESRLDAIVGSAMDGIITITRDQRIVLFNAAAERMFQCSAAQAIGTTLERFIPERFRAAHAAHIERFSQTGETSRRMGMQAALWALRADGREFPIEASISQAQVGSALLLTVILRDITERTKAEQELRRAHAELRELSLAMHEVREGERTRIARELHDELGQALTALKMDVDLLGSTIPEERSDLLERTDAMRELLDSTVATTRRISADLRPLVLDDLGLGAAAEWLAQTFSQRTHIPCQLSVDLACAQLAEPHASALFRIMQESLTNVARHAQANRVEVRLERLGDDAVLTVRDDGVGMDRSARPGPRSFGLRGIGERVMLLGGEMQIASRPGAGTTLVARIPVGRAGALTEAA